MTPAEIIRNAIPDAPDDLVEHIVWGRTPFPFAPLTAKDFYKAASRYRRASKKGKQLCDFCDRLAVRRFRCEQCDDALARARQKLAEEDKP